MQPDNPQQPANPYQPEQPAEQPAHQPAAQTEHPHAPAEHHAPAAHHSDVKAVEHVSNPYIATTDGLVTILKTNPVAAMLSMVLGFLVSLPLFIPVLITSPRNGDAASPINALLTIIWYLLLIPLIGGTSLAVASASAREEHITTKQAIKAALSKALPFIGLVILAGLMVAVGMILLIIPGLILLARLSLASVILFEENVGPIQAIKRSFALTKGHFFEMWGAIIASMFMTGGGLLSPAASVAPLLARYQQYKSIEAGKTTANKVHWLNYFNVLAPALLTILIIALIGAGIKSIENRLDDTPATPTYSSPTFEYDSSPSSSDYNYDF